MSDSPQLSVVIASVNGLPYLERCLDSLAERAPYAEVIVADWTDDATRERVRERFPSVRLLSFDRPMAVPELRAAGIAEAGAEHVAVIEDHCVVRDGWADHLLDAHRRGHPVVGGPIRNGATARIRDWAAFFCEYSAFMEPMQSGPASGLTGMNVSYNRPAIESMGPLLREGRWETWLHPHLQRAGFELYAVGDAVLDHVKDFDLREFVSQRWHYARSHAGMRNPELGRKRWVYVVGSPAIVPLMYSRIARSVLARRRHVRELALSTPLILLYLAVWAAGEAAGHALGGGRSILRVR